MENDVTDGMVYRLFFLGRNFVSSLIFTLNLKKLKNLKTFSKKPRFFTALIFDPCTSVVYTALLH